MYFRELSYKCFQTRGLLVPDTSLVGRHTTGVHVQAVSKDLRGEGAETSCREIQSVRADLRQRTRAQDRLRGLSVAEAEDAARANKLLPIGDGLLRRQVQQRSLRSDER